MNDETLCQVYMIIIISYMWKMIDVIQAFQKEKDHHKNFFT